MHNQQWVITILAVAVAVLSVLLITGWPGGTGRDVLGQEAAVAGYIIGLSGTEKNSRLPFIIIDTKEQTIMAYEYNYSSRDILLGSVRSYRFDRQLGSIPPFEFTGGRAGSDGPSVQQVQAILRRATGGAH